MLITKTGTLALKSLMYLSTQARASGGISVSEIAKEIGESQYTTAKVLQLLSKKGIVASKTGPFGGYFILPQNLDVSLLEILKISNGKPILSNCLLGLEQCSDEKPCPIHHLISPLKTEFSKILDNAQLQNFVQGILQEKTFLNR